MYNEIVHNKIGDFMRKIRKRREKRKKRIIIISAFLCLIIMASGYAAFSTNIVLRVKGNIIPSCNIGGIIINTVTEGEGLYKDEYEKGRCVYRGTNPNNYIEFNGELWRIIAKEADGTYKILRNEALPSRAFDSGGARTTGYCSQGEAPYWGCNAWSSTIHMVGSPSEFVNGQFRGTINKDSEMLTYLNGVYYNDLNSEAQGLIVNHDYGIVVVEENNTDLAAQIAGENRYKWNGKVGLISHSDYLNANSNQELCGTDKTNYENYTICRGYDWMYISGTYWWTLSPAALYTYSIFRVRDDGYIHNNRADLSYAVRPAVFLGSSLSFSGSGTESNPFVIIN